MRLVELALATPVVIWAGAPLFRRGWDSLRNRSLNMFTLIAIGTGTAYLYSLVATLAPALIPATMRDHAGTVPVYFEAAAVIVVSRAARPGARATCAQRDVRRDPRTARPRTEDRAPDHERG